MEVAYVNPSTSTSGSFGYERKPKVVLRDREMYMVHLLRENNIRTMDIAKMMKVSERSVTRLLAKARELDIVDYDADVVEEVERLMAEKDEILNADAVNEGHKQSVAKPGSSGDDSKRKLGISLLAMNVKNKDIAKMLDVCEKTVQRWKAKMNDQQSQFDEEEDLGHSYIGNLLPAKIEVNDEHEDYGDYEETIN